MISHDLGAVKYVSSWIAVMYLGKIIEIGESDELYSNPLSPYTQALLSAALPSHPDKQRDEFVLPGEVPNPLNLAPGCRFSPRCTYAKAICRETEPSLKSVAKNHKVACYLC